MKKTKKNHLLLYCRVGSKKLLSFDRTFFSRIDYLTDDIDYTPTNTGVIACIKSKIDIADMHKQLMKHSIESRRSRPIILIDLKSGSAKGNLTTIQNRASAQPELDEFKFDAFIGKRKQLEATHGSKHNRNQVSEEEINAILDEITQNGIESLEKTKLRALKSYSKYLRSQHE